MDQASGFARKYQNARKRGAVDAERPVIRVGAMDYTIFLVAVLLAGIGVVMVFSATYLTAASSKKFNNDSAYFLWLQLRFVVMGIIVMYGMSRITYRFWRKIAPLVYAVCIPLLIVVFFIGVSSHGQVRWIPLPIIGQFQPSEVAKFAVILMVASLVANNRNILMKWSTFLFVCAFVLIPTALIVIGNLSTAIIVAVVGMGMIFIASPHTLRFVVAATLGGGGLGGYLWWTYKNPGEGFRGGRIAAWLDPFNNLTGEGARGYQVVQSLYAIGSGGLFGLGLGQSRQKTFIPEAHNDIIFSIICEELGFVGAAMILLLFGVLIWRGIRVAINAPDTFSALAATGIVILISGQVLINVAVVTNTIPNTGIPLPLISYGGTSLIMMMAMIGLLLNISRHSKASGA